MRNLVRTKPLVREPAEPTYGVEITVETDAQTRNRDNRNQEKRVTWKNNVIKRREKGRFCKKNIYNGMTQTQNSEAICSYVLEQKVKDNCNKRTEIGYSNNNYKRANAIIRRNNRNHANHSFRKNHFYLSETKKK